MNDITAPSTTPGLGKRRGILIGSAAAGALALGAGGLWATSAFFTAQATVENNTVTTATLTIGETASSPLTVSGLLPDQNAPAQDVLEFTNSGSVPFTYTVTLDTIETSSGSPAALPGWVPITVTSGGQTKTGTLAAPPTVTVDSLAPQAAATVEVTVGLDKNADNTAQGRTVTFNTTVTAQQK